MISKLMIKLPSDRKFHSATINNDYFGFKFSVNGLVVLERAVDLTLINKQGEELFHHIKVKEKTIFEEDELNQIGEFAESLLAEAEDAAFERAAELQIGKKCRYVHSDDISLLPLIEKISTEENEMILNKRIDEYVSLFTPQNNIQELW